jgi:hypothetical protein
MFCTEFGLVAINADQTSNLRTLTGLPPLIAR